MKNTANKGRFWQSEYVRPALILLFCYIFINAFGWPFDRFDFIFILYILYLNRINEKTALGYALVFGIAYDISYPVFFGLGILFFQALNFIKIKASMVFDVNKAMFGVGLTVFIIMLYFMLTLKFLGYGGGNYWLSLFKYLKYNIVCLVLMCVVFGGGCGLSYSKR